MLRDRVTGEGQDLGAPAGCGLAGTPAGRAIVRVSAPPFSLPAVAVENDVVAFLESEMDQNRCVENNDDDFADAILRIVRLGGGEVTYTGPLRAVDAAPILNAQPLVVSNGRVFVRSSEAAMAKRLTQRVAPGAIHPILSVDGRFVLYTYDEVRLLDLQTSTTEVISVGLNGQPAGGGSFAFSMSPDARFVAFVSSNTNL